MKSLITPLLLLLSALVASADPKFVGDLSLATNYPGFDTTNMTFIAPGGTNSVVFSGFNLQEDGVTNISFLNGTWTWNATTKAYVKTTNYYAYDSGVNLWGVTNAQYPDIANGIWMIAGSAGTTPTNNSFFGPDGFTGVSGLILFPASVSSTHRVSSANTNLLNVGSNNINNYGLNLNQLDNYSWGDVRQATIALSSNINRFAWTRFLGKVYSNQPVTLFVQTDGFGNFLGESSIVRGLPYFYSNTLPINGYGDYTPSQNYVFNSTNSDGTLGPGWRFNSTANTNWYGGYVELTNTPNQLIFSNFNHNGAGMPVANTYIVYYEKWANGGTFDTYTNKGTGWTLNTQFDGHSAATTMGQILFPNQASDAMSIMFSNSASATNRFMVMSYKNTTNNIGYGTNNSLFYVRQANQGGQTFQTMAQVQTNTFGVFLALLNPDLIIIECAGQTNNAGGNIATLCNLFTNWVPTTPVVFCGIWPQTSDTDGNGISTDLDRYLVQLQTEQYARQYGFSFFDVSYAFESWSNVLYRGFSTTNNAPHLVQAGADMYNAFLRAWMGLAEYPPSGRRTP